MRFPASLLPFLLAPAFAGSPGLPEGFTPLFNGKDLRGWHVSRINHHGKTGEWRVENGILVARQRPIGEGGILLTDKHYRDYEIYLEIKPDFGCDGGLFLRSNEEGRAYQIMFDYLPGGSVGGLNGEGLPFSRERSAARRADWQRAWRKNDWNAVKVRFTGEIPHITVWMNGEQILDYQDDRNYSIGGARDGMIALQMHFSNRNTPRWAPGGMHRFRNIGIRVLQEAK